MKVFFIEKRKNAVKKKTVMVAWEVGETMKLKHRWVFRCEKDKFNLCKEKNKAIQKKQKSRRKKQ